METINLDDSDLFVIDERPCTDVSQTNSSNFSKRKRKSLRKKLMKKMKLDAKKTMGQPQNTTNHYFLMGGDGTTFESDSSEKNKSDTIVIEDDSDDSSNSDDDVIIVSDDESKIGIIGGELSSVVHSAQRKQGTFQRKLTNNNKKSPICIDVNDNENNQFPAENSERKLRPIVIDGSNVAFGHGKTAFSSRGIEICCDYFLKRGHTVKVFIPQFRRRHMATQDTHILDKLEKDGIVVFTPSRMVNGKNIVSYDDRMMVEYAAQSGAIIVTRDNLRDLASESKEFQKIISDRILMFTWVDSEVILFPQDPLGREGPKLNEFLSFPLENEIKTEKQKKKTKK